MRLTLTQGATATADYGYGGIFIKKRNSCLRFFKLAKKKMKFMFLLFFNLSKKKMKFMFFEVFYS